MFKAQRGLKICYKVEDKILSQHFKTIEDFLQTEFPKSNNPLSPTLDTEITEIKWNGSTISIPNKIRTVRDLTDLLSKENVENIFISNRDVRLHKIKPKHDDLIRKSTYSIEYVHSKVKDVLFEKDKRNAKVDFDGDLIKGNSKRYQTFLQKAVNAQFVELKDNILRKKGICRIKVII